ncbi:MAG: TonB-dependent receptor [Pseudomonadota bacterium]
MKRSLLMGAVTGAMVVGGANGQSVDTSGDDEEIRLDPISVYATRNPIPAFDYPGQVTVVERPEILDFNPSTLQEVFQAIPGAQFDSGPRRTGDAPSIRGLSESSVLIFLDGARQSFLSGHDGRFFVDPELIQTIEVVRGPSSALYGSGALGGVIATRTITAQDVLDEGEQFGFRVTSGFQSVNNEYRVGGTGVWQSADGLIDVVANVTYRDSGDIELGNDLTLPADDEILSSLLKTTIRPTDDLEIYASWMRYGGDSTDPQNPQGLNVAGPTNELVFRDAENNTLQGGVNWNPASNDLINLNFVGYYADNSVQEDEVENPRTTDRSVETFGFLLDNRSQFTLNQAATLTFTYGGEYYQDQQTGLDTETADGSRGGVPDAETDFFGVFLQADLSLTDLGPIPGELSIIPGIRWDSFETSEPAGTFDIDEDEFTPKIGVSYKPIPELLIFGNYAEGFRAPSFNEAFADGVHFTVPNLTAPPGPFGPVFVSNLFIPNPDLVPEESNTWEIGAGVDLDGIFFGNDAFTAKASYYNSDVDNLIGLDVQTPLGCFFTPQTAPPGVPPFVVAAMPCGTGPEFGNTSQNTNIANAEIEGVEVEFTYDSDYFYTRGNITTIDGVDADNGEFLEGVLTPNTLFLDTGVKWEPWGLRGGVRVTFADDFNEVNDPGEERSGFVFGDIYAVWEPPFETLEGVRLDLGVDNVADTDFDVVFAGVSQPGRNYKVALSWSKGF